MAVKIPKGLHEDLLSLSKADDATFDFAINAIQKMPLVISRDAITSSVKQQYAKDNPEKLLQILETGIAVQAIFLSKDVSESAFLSEILDGMKVDASTIDILDEKRFFDRVSALLSIYHLKIIAKSINLLTESERLLYESRVLTDIRPIFGENASNKPDGALIIHSLHMHYHQNRNGHEFFIALDSRDIKDLITELQRALEKEKSLKSILKAADVKNVKVHPEEEED